MQRKKNSSGYWVVRESRAQPWELEHRRVWRLHHEREIPKGYEVHHIDGDRTNNTPSNLVLMKKEVHRRLHRKTPGACFLCGRSGHWAERCDSDRLFNGKFMPTVLKELRDAW